MKNSVITQSLLLITLLLSGTNLQADDIEFRSSYSPEILQGIDWGKAEKITILFEDNNYAPDDVSLIEGKPYIFEMKNVGERAHDFVDLKFFHDIIVERI